MKTGDYDNEANSKPKFKITDAKLYVPVVNYQFKIMKNY